MRTDGQTSADVELRRMNWTWYTARNREIRHVSCGFNAIRNAFENRGKRRVTIAIATCSRVNREK